MVWFYELEVQSNGIMVSRTHSLKRTFEQPSSTEAVDKILTLKDIQGKVWKILLWEQRRIVFGLFRVTAEDGTIYRFALNFNN